MTEHLLIINIIAIIVGPIIAVLITLFYQNYRNKRNDQEHLFKILMVHRKSYQIDPEWVRALNMIPIYFSKNKNILTKWNEYYALLHGTGDNVDELRAYSYLDLLSNIAQFLGYKHLKQTDIDKYYFPKIHGEMSQQINELLDDVQRIAKNTERVLLEKKKDKT